MPVLNEAALITDALRSVTELPNIDEVIVVDGGSSDGTCGLVELFSTVQLIRADRVLRAASPGRATTPAPLTWNFYAETDGARRVIKWTRDDGQSAELLRSTRLPYWQLHDEGHERHLQDLGLHIRPPATP